MKIKILLLISVVFLMHTNAQEKAFESDWTSLKKHTSSPEWFADAKFGIYFHWGIYAVPATGGEWYPRWMYVPDRKPNQWGHKIYNYHKNAYGENFQYHDFIPKWKADKFDAKEWVALFEKAGAKIIGSIAEHHDGFSLWNSTANPWNSAKMGPEVDVVGAIAKETRKRNLKFMTTFHHGFHLMFYPKAENTWLRPVSTYQFVYKKCEVPQEEKYALLYGNLPWEEANDLWLNKLNEVMHTYTPDYIWMDFGQRFVKESHRKEFLANYFNLAHQLKKEVVVNTKGSFFPKELAVINIERATMPDIQKDVWVTDFILGSSWCYDKNNRTAIDPKKAIRILADVVSKNGVLLLSAGPKADGSIPIEQVNALKQIGKWMTLYGEAIYNTRPFLSYGQGNTQFESDGSDAFKQFGALKLGFDKLNSNDIRYTTKGNIVYAIQLGWTNKKAPIILKVFNEEAKAYRIKKIKVLGSNETIKWKKTLKGLEIQSPTIKPTKGEFAIVYKIEIER